MLLVAVALQLLTSGSSSFLYVFCISSSPCLCSLASLFLLLFLKMMVLLLMVARGGGVASNGKERDQKRGRLLFFSSPLFLVFMFFSFTQIFPSLFFFVFNSSGSQTDIPLCFSQRENVLRFPLFFFLTFPLFFVCFFISIFHSFSSFPLVRPSTHLSPLLLIRRKRGKESYYPYPIMAQG
jgi:hypothetical protein